MREDITNIGVKFIVSILVLLMSSAVGITYFLQESQGQDQDLSTTTNPAQNLQQDIDQKRQINGVNILYYKPQVIDDIQSYSQQFIERLASLGTTDIAVAIPVFMSSGSSVDVTTTSDTPTDEDLQMLIDSAIENEINVILKPIVDGLNEAEFVRQEINPAIIDDWFDSYFQVISPFLEQSQENGLNSFVIGVELSSLQKYRFKWSNLIEKAKLKFDGGITYAVNWDALDSLTFVENLDYLGVDAYFPYEGEIDNKKLKVFWHDLFDKIPFTENEGFIVHEYGIPSEVGAEAKPWKAEGVNSVSEWLQDSWIRAACDVIHQRTRGGYIWAVYFGTDLDQTREDKKGYNILGKPLVENTISDCFSWY